MPIRDGRLVFGYDGDGGLGRRLVQQVLDRKKTATALPRAEVEPEMLRDTLASVGKEVMAIDVAGELSATIRVEQVYECLLREPTPGLLRGEGYGADVDAFVWDHFATMDPRMMRWRSSLDAVANDLRRLPPGNRLVVTLHDGLEWSASEIIAATGFPEQRVSQLLRRGRMILRRERGEHVVERLDPGPMTLIAVEFALVGDGSD
jgi:uncharacterized protein YhfF